MTNLHRQSLLGTLLIAGFIALTGCGGTRTADNAGSTEAYNDAEKAMEAGDYVAAIPHWTQAMDAGGLNPDQYADARIRRGECYGRTGDFAAAHADLDNAEMGAPELDRVYATRAFVFGKEGKKKEAATAMSKAKKENRSVKRIK